MFRPFPYKIDQISPIIPYIECLGYGNTYLPSKIEWDLTNRLLKEDTIELLDAQIFFGVRSVGAFGDFLEP